MIVAPMLQRATWRTFAAKCRLSAANGQQWGAAPSQATMQQPRGVTRLMESKMIMMMMTTWTTRHPCQGNAHTPYRSTEYSPSTDITHTVARVIHTVCPSK